MKGKLWVREEKGRVEVEEKIMEKEEGKGKCLWREASRVCEAVDTGFYLSGYLRPGNIRDQ